MEQWFPDNLLSLIFIAHYKFLPITVWSYERLYVGIAFNVEKGISFPQTYLSSSIFIVYVFCNDIFLYYLYQNFN
jgi:hypothetical protein